MAIPAVSEERPGCGRILEMTSALAFCRDCFDHLDWTPQEVPAPVRCPACHSPRILAHEELADLAIAHVDCDAFYAAVEKRDNPDLHDKPVIIGGGKRGVVATACYTARIFGVHSAMPMFKALKACPDAVVLKPNMAKYSEVGKQVRQLMHQVTPLVEPLSIDEAFLDLTGTTRLHKQTPAETLARLAARIEQEIGITVSIGLAHNKFLAKLSSDLDKPKGFSIIGKAETQAKLAPLPITKICGVGKATARKLKRNGLHTLGQLQGLEEKALIKRYGDIGRRLARLSHGEDVRRVNPTSKAKSISAETTFADDIRDLEDLSRRLWLLSEKVSFRMKVASKAGQTVTLKLKTADFRIRTRSRTLLHPTQLAEAIFQDGRALLAPEADGTPFRLIGIGMSGLVDQDTANDADLFDDRAIHWGATERAIDQVREKFGSDAIKKGRALDKRK